MLELFTSVIVNYFTFVSQFIGLDFVTGFAVVLIALGFLYSLSKTKQV